ncbi:hypothetical protein CKY04_03920 [Photorhabdus sp. S8-52]|nr:hypothetical protein CKY03_03920 [Photorhabdus sp. S9-53]RAX02944.1 hypothetical protein CKY05_03925 [Photorhabdus sp. S10-54]RAX05683.1 hypothetical protein CKY04_03920 [Photorhabdus sp. S8-52]
MDKSDLKFNNNLKEILKLESSMSERGNCHDSVVTENFFLLLRRDCIKRKVYSILEEARSDIFDYIEMFYSSKCRHGSSNKMSLSDYEKDYFQHITFGFICWILIDKFICFLWGYST